ncbi:hypothetical protein V6R97_08600 [Chromohalobacter salexigens]|uniref:hypothetical protein n=1 Tax=Chromohalobacter israelensis TaxID=141390 RepID=UPI0032E8B01E
MIATCIYCGHQVKHGSRHSATQQEAHQALIEHDRECPQNPIARELAVERERADALAAQFQWRPIEEAEKYNGDYLLYGPDLVDLDFNETGVVEGHWQDDMGWVGAVWCGQHDCWHDTIIEPTHFLPKFNPESLPGASLARRLADERARTFARAASLCRHIENGQESLAWMHKETGPDGEDYVGERGIPYSNKALGANHCVDEMERQEKIARRQAKGGDA